MLDRVGKSVVFNRADPDQAMLLEHAEKRTNFSAYVKRLIYLDLRGGGWSIQVTEDRSTIDRKVLEGFI